VIVLRTAAAPLAALTLWSFSGCAAPGRVEPPRDAPDSARTDDRGPALPARGGRVEPAPAPPVPIRTAARVTIGAVGDVLMHDAVKRSAAVHGAGAPDAGFSWLFAPVADLLAEPDLTFANLETPVAAGASQGSRAFTFDAPPAVLSALSRAGVDVVSVANNHAFDQGRRGFEETLRRVSAAGIATVGAGPASRAAGPVRLERNGLTLAFLGYTYGLNAAGNACPAAEPECPKVSELDRARVVEEVRSAATTADAVIVSLHWGTEYEAQPRADDVALAHRVADAGALVVLGHHPHVLQPVELYRRADGQLALIAYSLGNFISNQSRGYVHGVTPDTQTHGGATRDAVLLRVAIARRDYGRGATAVELAGADVLPLWTENDTAELDGRRPPAIRIVAVDRALAETRAALSEFPDPVPPGARDRWMQLRRREALLVARREAIGAVIGDGLVRTLTPAELAPAGAPPRTSAGVTPSAGR
jgi:hypothetical protein